MTMLGRAGRAVRPTVQENPPAHEVDEEEH